MFSSPPGGVLFGWHVYYGNNIPHLTEKEKIINSILHKITVISMAITDLQYCINLSSFLAQSPQMTAHQQPGQCSA